MFFFMSRTLSIKGDVIASIAAPKKEDCHMSVKNKKNPRTNWKVGEKAYLEDTWSGLVRAAVVTFIETHKTGFPSAVLEYADVNYGTTCRPFSMLFDSEQDCLDALASESKDKIKLYESEIRTVEDLIRFAWNHHVSPGELRDDHDAQTAYKNRANDLLGIELEQ